MLAALDTNVLLYADGFGFAAADAAKTKQVQYLLRQLAQPPLLLVPVLAEFIQVLRRKGQQSAKSACVRAADWALVTTVETVPVAAVSDAFLLMTEHGLQTFDAMIVAGAQAAGATVLLSEDMHHGLTWNGLTVCNPFSHPWHPRLRAILAESS